MKMKNFVFLTREDYASLPIFLQKQMDERGCRIAVLVDKKEKIRNLKFSFGILRQIKIILEVALVYPEFINKEMVSGIGITLIGAEIELTPECEEAIHELVDAEIKKDIDAFLKEIIRKIDQVLF